MKNIIQERNMTENLVSAMQPEFRQQYMQLKEHFKLKSLNKKQNIF